jgi:hypothetical protein
MSMKIRSTVVRVFLETHLAAMMGELERILEQIAHSPEKQIAVAVHGQGGINNRSTQHALSNFGFQRS